MARTYKTLCLSMPPAVAAELDAIGKATNRVAARVAADIVLREMASWRSRPAENSTERSPARDLSSCCAAGIVVIEGRLVLDADAAGARSWVPVVVLLCEACRNQMHGREYEGGISSG